MSKLKLAKICKSRHTTRYLAHCLLIITSLCLGTITFAQEPTTVTPTDAPANDNQQLADDGFGSSVQDNDPHIKFNRNMFQFNSDLDKYIAKPVAKGYMTIFPQQIRTHVTNFYSNLDSLPTIANDILQGNLYQAISDAWRTAINSTIGIAGIFDVASHIGLEPHVTDFGLTMAKWGWRNSCFLVLPIIGPTTFRDGLGIPVDYYAFSGYFWFIDQFWIRAALLTVYYVNTRANLLQFEGLMQQAAFDPYIFQRNAYLQRRQALIDQTLAGPDWDTIDAQYDELVQPKSLVQVYGFPTAQSYLFEDLDADADYDHHAMHHHHRGYHYDKFGHRQPNHNHHNEHGSLIPLA